MTLSEGGEREETWEGGGGAEGKSARLALRPWLERAAAAAAGQVTYPRGACGGSGGRGRDRSPSLGGVPPFPAPFFWPLFLPRAWPESAGRKLRTINSSGYGRCVQRTGKAPLTVASRLEERNHQVKKKSQEKRKEKKKAGSLLWPFCSEDAQVRL